MSMFKICELLNTTENNQDWIGWDGSSDYPEGVAEETLVEVVLRDETTIEPTEASNFRWRHVHKSTDIVKYRVVNNGK